ncbi:clumping factor A [Drosophila biarmipes]|uniref:clumping factor A n=1 Tax=Drosophila biarmipes TaxID=125945 RepID=UPI0007E629B3|nr:clumping factor A [Drosophila biarmipes]XP_050740943.1 clumping factor A [Drosophila biarmipes]
MADGAANSKRDSASRNPMEMAAATQGPTLGAISLSEDAEPSSSSGSGSEQPTSSGETDSEGDANSTSDPDANAMVDNTGDPQTNNLYNPLAGDSDNDLDEVEIYCEETISLLAHEILCCEGDSDSETETETDGDEDTDEAKGSDKLEDILEYGLHNPYQLMFSEEDDENPNASDTEDTENTTPIVSETIVLLEEDQPSEEKPESPSNISSSGGFLVSTNISFE